MLSAALRQTSLALFFCAMAIGIAPASLEAAEKSLMYKVGRATAYAHYCGHRSLVKELRGRYGDLADFKKGRRENDLSKYDRVTGLACGALEDDLEAFLEKAKTREAR